MLGVILFMQPVSRAYEKLRFAFEHFGLDASLKVCADFGSSTGGFVQVWLEKDCAKVYSVETGKNRLHFVLKDDERVVNLDKTNAVYVELPEKVDLISIDVAVTPQRLIVPNAVKNLKDDGLIVSLVKPNYEAGEKILNDSGIEKILEKVREEISEFVEIIGEVESPIVGQKNGNREFLWLLRKLK